VLDGDPAPLPSLDEFLFRYAIEQTDSQSHTDRNTSHRPRGKVVSNDQPLRFTQFGHTIDEGRKLGGLRPFWVGAGSPSNTKALELRPTSIPSGILMHPVVWSQ